MSFFTFELQGFYKKSSNSLLICQYIFEWAYKNVERAVVVDGKSDCIVTTACSLEISRLKVEVDEMSHVTICLHDLALPVQDIWSCQAACDCILVNHRQLSQSVWCVLHTELWVLCSSTRVAPCSKVPLSLWHWCVFAVLPWDLSVVELLIASVTTVLLAAAHMWYVFVYCSVSHVVVMF